MLGAGILSFVGKLSLSQRLISKPHPSIPRLTPLKGVACGGQISNLCRHIQMALVPVRSQRLFGTAYRHTFLSIVWSLEVVCTMVKSIGGMWFV